MRHIIYIYVYIIYIFIYHDFQLETNWRFFFLGGGGGGATSSMVFLFSPVLIGCCSTGGEKFLLDGKNPTKNKWVFPKIAGFPPKSSHFNRVFHYFHHPFWGILIFGNTQMVGR